MKEIPTTHQNGHLDVPEDDGNPPPECLEPVKPKVLDDDDDPPAERITMEKTTNGTSGIDSGLDKSDSSDDASSTKSDPDVAGGKGDEKKKDDDEDKEGDVFFLPEVGFNVKIDAPGTENFEIQVLNRIKNFHLLLVKTDIVIIAFVS